METLKFNEFNALSEKLYEDGSSINEFVKETTGEYLFEADDAPSEEIDKKRPAWMWITSPKGAWAKKTLTKQAKKLLPKIKTDVIEKFYGGILQNQRKILQQAMALMKEGKSKEEVQESLSDNIDNAKAMQKKQLKSINSAIEKLIDNSTKRITSYIAKKELSDSHRLTLENYWVLLSTQLYQIAYNIMIRKEDEFLQEIIGENEDLVSLAKAISTDGYFEDMKKKKKNEVEQAKKDLKDGKDTKEGEDEVFDPEKYEVGDDWNYKNSKGKEMVVVITGKSDDGGVEVKMKDGPGETTVRKTGHLISKVGEEEEKPEEEKPEEEFDPKKYKKGEEWKYKGAKKEGVVVIKGRNKKGEVIVTQKGTKREWPVTKAGKLISKIEK